MRSILLLAAMAAPLSAQPVFTDVFPPEEYAARRARVMAKIGDGVAILQGTTERPGEQPLRQSNQFFYVSGVVEPRAILLIDGRQKRSTLFLNPRDERRESRAFGPGLFPGEAAAKATGMDAVLPREEFAKVLAGLGKGEAIYTPYRPEVLGSGSASGARDEKRSLGRQGIARRSVPGEAEGSFAAGGPGPGPDPRRAARY